MLGGRRWSAPLSSRYQRAIYYHIACRGAATPFGGITVCAQSAIPRPGYPSSTIAFPTKGESNSLAIPYRPAELYTPRRNSSARSRQSRCVAAHIWANARSRAAVGASHGAAASSSKRSEMSDCSHPTVTASSSSAPGTLRAQEAHRRPPAVAEKYVTAGSPHATQADQSGR